VRRVEPKQEKLPSLSGREALIMELLLQTPAVEMYGLELVRASENRLKRGTVYVTLGRLEEKGYLTSREEEPQPGASGIPRRLYRVTGHGQCVFELLTRARDARQLVPLVAGGIP
jgi:PadR family transcriptional regulator PadR